MSRAPRMVPYAVHETNGVDEDLHEAADMNLCRHMFEALIDKYPGHYWIVRADSKQGLAGVKIHQLMGDTLWFNIHLDRVTNWSDFRLQLMRAGGEILERYNIPRSGIHMGAFLDARARTPMRITPKTPIPEGDLRVFDQPKPRVSPGGIILENAA